jgi:hypothetical protein
MILAANMKVLRKLRSMWVITVSPDFIEPSNNPGEILDIGAAWGDIARQRGSVMA